jgi:4-alpha-glucanotransferase
MSPDVQLRELATLAGVQLQWVDAYGQKRQLFRATVERVLDCLGLPYGRDSLERLRSAASVVPSFITTDVGEAVTVPRLTGIVKHIVLHDEAGGAQMQRVNEYRQFTAPAAPGYYTLELDRHRITLAVAPRRCFGVTDAIGASHPRAWGLTAQVYSLPDANGGLGTNNAVERLASSVGAAGGDALCLSPLHAMPPGVRAYSPYSPSHRGFLNWMHTDPTSLLGAEALRAALEETELASAWQAAEVRPLVDWPGAHAMRTRVWRALYQRMEGAPAPLKKKFEYFQHQGGDALRMHALFEARQVLAAREGQSTSWRDWPIGWREHVDSTVDDFCAACGDEIDFSMFLQWAAARAWKRTSDRANTTMKIGLIVDVAVGFDPGGSEAWRNRDVLLQGITLGAPPDAFNAKGQRWGVTSYAPGALRDVGYQPFVELLRSNMRLGGGVRLDHVLGLSRLWVVPDGGPSSQGAYLNYPLTDLLRLVALESWRHRCIVIGEDLGTVAPELRAILAARGLLGTEVLLFNKDEHGSFLPPSRWRAQAVATTTTHDLPPLANWSRGLDIDAAKDRDFQTAEESTMNASARMNDVTKLTSAFKTSKEENDANSTWAFNDAALDHVSRSAASLVLIPLEDALGLTLQPNVPGTVDEYPNWRQRLPATTGKALDRAMSIVAKARKDKVSDV